VRYDFVREAGRGKIDDVRGRDGAKERSLREIPIEGLIPTPDVTMPDEGASPSRRIARADVSAAAEAAPSRCAC